jgi:undecaprenyl-diphosphatase
LVVIALCALGFYELGSDINTSVAVARFDAAATRFIRSFRSPAMDFAMKIITHTASILGMSLLTLALFLYLRRMGRNPEAAATVILVIGGVALADTFKRVFKRVRPAEALALIRQPGSASFPSGHSMSSLCWAMAAANAIMLAPNATPLTKVVVCVLCALYALAVGVSRVYLGVHHASDVAAAWLLGLAWASAVTGFYYWRRKY